MSDSFGSALYETPPILSSWDDLLEGISGIQDWKLRRIDLQRRFLELLRDTVKPPKPLLDLQIEETVVIADSYERLSITYAVEAGERVHAYLGIPLNLIGPTPAVVALHGTTAQGTEQTVGLSGDPNKAYLDPLCRKGFIVIAPEHFSSGRRIPPEGPYDTAHFYRKHPEWTAVGKSTFENSIAIDVLQSLPQVDSSRIGCMGHSLGGHGSFFLAAYDERVTAVAGNCAGGTFRHSLDVELWARDHWYVYFKHLRPLILARQPLPIDLHEIIALIAPRAFLDLSALNDGDSASQHQRVLMMLKLAELYALLDQSGQFSFFVHGQGHSMPLESRQLIEGFLSARLTS